MRSHGPKNCANVMLRGLVHFYRGTDEGAASVTMMQAAR